MSRSDLISLLTVCFAALPALYDRWAAIQAHKANEISIALYFKPRRLSIYKDIKEFLHYCSIYVTKYIQGMVLGTVELMIKRYLTNKFGGRKKPHHWLTL